MEGRPSKPARGARVISRRRRVTLALALAGALAPAAPAWAQEGVVVAPVEPAPAAPPARPPAVPLDYNTAHLVGARRLKIGILSFDYGLTDFLSVGSDPPEWALRSVSSILVPNLHVKGRFVRTSWVEVSGEAAGYYASIDHADASGHVLLLPFTLYVSTRLTSRLWLHLEGAYNWSRAWGAGDVAKTDVFGTVVMRTLQLGAMAEYKLSRVVAVIVRGRWQPYETPIVFEGDGMIDPYTHVQASLEAKPTESHPAMVIGGVSLTWKYVGVVAGAGYGHYFVPGANLALPYKNVVPEGALWALF